VALTDNDDGTAEVTEEKGVGSALLRHHGPRDPAKAVHEKGLRSVSGSSGVDGQAQPGVLTAADWMAAMDEPSVLRARPEATFENRHRPSRHGADASSVGHDGGVRFGGTAEAKAEFGATNIGFGRPLRAFTRVSAKHAE